MALLLNATRKMQDSVVLTSPSYKGRYPQNTRDAIQIAKAHKSGIFQIERAGARKLYDRCYIFKDINAPWPVPQPVITKSTAPEFNSRAAWIPRCR